MLVANSAHPIACCACIEIHVTSVPARVMCQCRPSRGKSHMQRGLVDCIGAGMRSILIHNFSMAEGRTRASAC